MCTTSLLTGDYLMTEPEVLELCGRLCDGLMNHSGLNIETHEWHAIAGFLASTPSAVGDWRVLLDHETRRPPVEYQPGSFTAHGKILCPKCLGQTGVKSATLKTCGDGYALTTCQTCNAEIITREDVALLRNLQLLLPRGWYPRIEQTGGMCCNLSMDVAGAEYMVWVNDDREVEKTFGVCWYPDSEGDSSDTRHVAYFTTADEAVVEIAKHRFRFGVRV